MFRILRKKTKKFELEKIVKNNFFSSYLNFVFTLYILISPNLHIILKNITYPSRSQRGAPTLKTTESLTVNPRNGTLSETQKIPSVL